MSGPAAATASAPAWQVPRGFTPRESQRAILSYDGGPMGIAAVPGSGKTETVSMLVDRILDLQVLDGEQEILVVTLVNAACDNLARRVDQATAARTLMPGVGYRVRTLHSLAADVVRERPEAVGLTDAFGIVDQEQCDQIRRQVAVAWLRGNGSRCEWLLDPELPEERRAFVRRERLPGLIEDLGADFIRYAKGERVRPDQLQAVLRDHGAGAGGDGDDDARLAEIGTALYADYQRALSYRGALDFDDLIWRALDLLEADPELRGRLRERWPFILEDEAQDSSEVQERILSLLAGEQGNWVRVGDPNQAIFETFTTADPRFLREFLDREDVAARELPESGRSAPRIIAVANRMIDWTTGCHPVAEARDALGLPHVSPTPPGDPQPNPPDAQATVAFIDKPFAPEREAAAVADSVSRFLPANPDATVAVLAPSNHRAGDLVQAIRERGMRCVESLLASTGATRAVAEVVGHVLRALAEPGSAFALADCYLAWRRADRDDPKAWAAAEAGARRVRGLRGAGGLPLAAPGPRLAGRAGRRRGRARALRALRRPGTALAGGGGAADRPARADRLAGPVRRARRAGGCLQAGGEPAASRAHASALGHPRDDRRAEGDRRQPAPVRELHAGSVRLRSRGAPRRGGGRHHAQGQGVGVGPGLPDLRERLRLSGRPGRRPVHRREVVLGRPAQRGNGGMRGGALPARRRRVPTP